MTAERLKQFRHLKKEIEDLEQRISRSQVTDVVSGSDRGFPYTQHHVTITGIDQRALRRLRRKQQQCRMEYDEIAMWIDNIEDSQLRMIFRARYMDGKTWQQVAFAIDEKDESYPRRKHDKYLKLAENAENNVIKWYHGKNT